MLRKMVAAVLALLLVLSAVSVYAEDLTWGMTQEQVTGMMGMPDEVDTDVSPGNVILRYRDQHISKFDSATLVLAFRNDALFTRAYGIPDTSESTFTYLKGALEQKYGASATDSAVVVESLTILGLKVSEATLAAAKTMGSIDYLTWYAGEDTNIVLLMINSGDSIAVTLFYILPVDQIADTQYNMDGL